MLPVGIVVCREIPSVNGFVFMPSSFHNLNYNTCSFIVVVLHIEATCSTVMLYTERVCTSSSVLLPLLSGTFQGISFLVINCYSALLITEGHLNSDKTQVSNNQYTV